MNSPSLIWNGYIYRPGGLTAGDGIASSVIYAPLNSDGSIGSWATTSPLLFVSNDHAGAVVNGVLYISGGLDILETASHARTTVLYARANANGTLGQWTSTTPLPAARWRHGMVTDGHFLYVVGGRDNTNLATSTVYYAPVNADGTVGAWSTTTSLPATLADSGVTIATGHIYVLGGIRSVMGGDIGNTVYYAAINSDGTLGPSWLPGANLPSAIMRNSAIAVNGALYSMDGTTTNTAAGTVSDVYVAPINPDGSTGSWSAQAPTPSKLKGQSVATNLGFIYLLGGETETDSIPPKTVYFVSTSPPPPPDVTPPQISAVQLASVSVTISWTTNKPSDSQVEYGTTISYGSLSPLNSALVTSHSVTISSLLTNTFYHYRVRSTDASGNLGLSGDFTFMTPGP